MGQSQGITQELTLGEVISKTFDLYRSNLFNYLIIFAIIEGIIGVLTYVIQLYVGALPTLPTNPTSQQISSYLGSFFAAAAVLLLVTFLLSAVFLPVAEGTTIRMASDELQKGTTDMGASLSFAFSKLLSMWVLFIVVGIIVVLGFIALIVPGIILAIMFSLCLPVLLIENKGVLESMSRSRQLVGQRWLKTFATFLVLGIIIAVISLVLGFITAPLGRPASTILSSILSAIWAPVIPIALTVYYYSNVARTSPGMGSAPMAPGAVPQAGMKFCPNCGAQMPSAAVFCPKCGTRQMP